MTQYESIATWEEAMRAATERLRCVEEKFPAAGKSFPPTPDIAEAHMSIARGWIAYARELTNRSAPNQPNR